MRRVFAVFLAAVLLPACDGDDDDDGGSPALFSDDFNRSQVGFDWAASPGTGSAAIDGSQGNPAPALGMSVSQGNSAATACSARACASKRNAPIASSNDSVNPLISVPQPCKRRALFNW